MLLTPTFSPVGSGKESSNSAALDRSWSTFCPAAMLTAKETVHTILLIDTNISRSILQQHLGVRL